MEQDLEPLLTTQQEQLSLVFSDSDSIDTKALTILGANIAILIFIDQAALHLHVWQFVLLYAPFVMSLALDVMSIWPRRYKGPGVDLDKHPAFLKMDRDTLILQLLSNTRAALLYNSALNKKRMRACISSVVLTGFGFLALLLII